MGFWGCNFFGHLEGGDLKSFLRNMFQKYRRKSGAQCQDPPNVTRSDNAMCFCTLQTMTSYVGYYVHCRVSFVDLLVFRGCKIRITASRVVNQLLLAF